MNLLDFNNFYLVGIKGVAMTSMTQLLIDAQKNVSGSDVAEEFVTQEILNHLNIKIDTDFNQEIPLETECVIYTAAHQSLDNPQVQQALEKGIPVISQAEAVSLLFNQQSGIAVCGVGGKSTVSAMISWILDQLKQDFSFSVGVGNIPGINKTGQWHPQAKYFVIEADEYVVNPQAKPAAITPRFSFLKPDLTICTNLKFDHPDVYQDFTHTQQIYNQFFSQIKPGGKLIINYQDKALVKKLSVPIKTFGENPKADLQLTSYDSQLGKTITKFTDHDQNYQLKLQIPGKFNALNALAAILTVTQIGVKPQQAANTLTSFLSTKRRFEFIGEKNKVKYYDDYAHHPHEVKAAIAALNDWYPHQKKVIAFQSHTYSRTKKLFTEFVDSFSQADEVVMIDIFSSAREKADLSITSDKLCSAIQKKHHLSAKNLHQINHLAEYCQSQLKPGDVFITLGAGDIYQVHDLI